MDRTIFEYSRAQAIADGLLVDVTMIAAEAGLRIPVAVTAAVWQDCVEWSEQDTKRKGVPQDIQGRLWDVLWMLAHSIRLLKDQSLSSLQFTVLRVPRGGSGVLPRKVELKCVCGPGDHGEPVLTVMQPDED